jgi:hypothetical protein
LTTEPATPVLYVVKLPVETARVWDCYLASYCTRTNAPTYYWCIGIFWLHESSRHRFPEVGRPWHHWQITVNDASDNQSAAYAITNILLSQRKNLARLIYELLFPNSWPKNPGAAYTRANTVCLQSTHTQFHFCSQKSSHVMCCTTFLFITFTLGRSNTQLLSRHDSV